MIPLPQTKDEVIVGFLIGAIAIVVLIIICDNVKLIVRSK